LTEAIAVTVPHLLVGVTDWCTHPSNLTAARVRGTKNPDIAAIVALRPDIVLANLEENRRIDVQRLRASSVTVWVTAIQSLPDAFTMTIPDAGRPGASRRAGLAHLGPCHPG
jgi:ABC-type hemin transport system substrate-binding protein